VAQVFTKKFGINPLLAVTNIVLVASSFVWYFLAYNVLQNLVEKLQTTPTETLIVVGANVAAIAIMAILGSFIVERIQRREPMLTLWIFAGIFVSLIPGLFAPSTFVELVTVSVIFGGYFGLGMPATMGYFSASTRYENRARLGGIVFLFIALSFFVLGSLSSGDIIISSVVLAAIRIAGLVFFKLAGKRILLPQKVGKTSYIRIFSGKSLLLFLVPWIVFNLVNYMTIPIINNPVLATGYTRSLAVFESVLIAVFAFVTGFLADSLGRKRLAIIGFAMLGVGFAALSFLQSSYGWYIYTVADGVAWGIFNVLFLFTLWGDLAQERNGEKFYVIGSLPYLLSNFMGLLFAPFALLEIENITLLFSFASFFLFIAVLPLVYAPETLPEKLMKDRDIRSYAEKALRQAQKDAGKSKKNDSAKEKEKNGKEEAKETPEDEEARKLAEKYY
jgi:MFS family permease